MGNGILHILSGAIHEGLRCPSTQFDIASNAAFINSLQISSVQYS